jgi:CRISPR-associated protein Csh2
MSELISKRSELLFCYDIVDANPNGDPLDENKPRIDEETKTNIVTDVRLKRTVRDYLYDYKGYDGDNGKDVFVREEYIEKGNKVSGIQDGKTRAKDFKNNPKLVINNCIDVRLFGGVIPLDKDSITYTGPVQFKMGRSLHPVELKHIKGTGAFASKPGAQQKTFREEYVLHYSYITFHGIINEVAAQHTQLTEDDVKELLGAMWHGTKNLISRSKFGQMPRLLVKVNYKNSGFFIGDLEKRIKIDSSENLLKLRSISQFKLDISALVASLNNYKDEIDSVEYFIDENLSFSENQNIPENWNKLQL